MPRLSRRTGLPKMYGIEGLLAGRTLVDRYHVLQVIGRGGMGAVYRARDQRLGREVALKVVTVAAADPDAHRRLRGRFHREARAAAQLHHPNVVAVYDFGTDPELGLDFLVMELLRGEDLAARLYRGVPTPVADAVRILHQAACGLAAGHRAGLIHRDVKPGNLYVEPGDRPGELRIKVLDFGIAEVIAGDELTMTHLTVEGRSPFSPAFASPEQLRGETRLAPATDVFSLGAVGFQLLTGERAFSATDPARALVEIAAAQAVLRERAGGIPPRLREVVATAMAAHPDDRFADAGEMASALEPLLRGRADDDVPAPVREPPRARPREEPRDADDSTRLLTGPPPPRRSAATGSGTRFAPGRQPMAPELQALLQRSPAPPPPAPAEQDEPPTPGWARRTARVVWSFLVTTLATVLFAASWLGVVAGLENGDLTLVYLAAAASVVLTPFALHRIQGGRGSYRFALFASIVGSILSIFLMGDSEQMEVVLATMFVAQVVLSFGAERLSRPSQGSQTTDPQHTPGRA